MSQITVSTVVNAPVAHAWEVFTNPEQITQWNFASDDWCCPSARNDLREGGSFSYLCAAKDGSMSFDYAGVYTAVRPLEQIAYTLGDGRRVTVMLEPISSAETRVTEIFDLENINSEELQHAGWSAVLAQYKQRAETI